MSGLLRIAGLIRLEQFWPNGYSDADTSKIRVDVNADSFAFAADKVNFKTTDVFNDAFSLGKGRKKLIDAQNRITVRLQGIDAPELHFKAASLKKGEDGVTDEKRKAYNAANKVERRQYQAETATVALAAKLAEIDPVEIPCLVISLVNKPSEVVDTYGRFIGNVLVGENFGTDINLWLTEKGWAYPTFYSSMEKSEIEALLAAMRKAGKRNVWKYYSFDASIFDPDLLYRKPGSTIDAKADKGPILMPKLYRRQVAYRMQKQAKIFKGSFKSFLQKKPDLCYKLKNFLDVGIQSATQVKLDQFLEGNTFTVKPHEIVFAEKPSVVVNGKGKRVEEF